MTEASNEEIIKSSGIRSWNGQVAIPRTLSVLCPLFLIDENGKKLRLRTHSLRNHLRGQAPSIFSVPLEKMVGIRSFFFSPDQEGEKGSVTKAHTRSQDGDECVREIPLGENLDLSLGSCDDASQQESFFDASQSITRIRVPADVVKIEDRLGYILQPPIETWLGRRALETPFEPFNYQKQGIAFLFAAQHAILADEMGLGKTMQAITTVRLLFRCGECRRVLLVCPKPLLTNWKREFELWAPEIPVQIIEGKSERRKWLWKLENSPLKIANYELLNRDRIYYDSEEDRVVYDLVILDESQRIKNKLNATSEAARAIPRRRSWALTGTPVENSAEDLVGIFEFLSPGFLESGLKPDQISKLVGDHILRRTKEQVLTDLPPKMIRDAHLELTPEQYETYSKVQTEGEMKLNSMGDSVTIQRAFELILHLKQICNFDPITGKSAKLEQLEADMEEIAGSGRKAIVFSQWVQTIKWLSERLKRFGPLEYHGKTKFSDRDSVINRFKHDKDCHLILMSYGAGSVGLNLQFAEYVFLFDRWWNPAIEDQAINRAHRIGAVGPVTVTRFVSVNTIEEQIDHILTEKRMLSEAILSDAKGLNYSVGLSQEDIFGLFNLKAPPLLKKHRNV